jgi:hypothetical protein
MLNTASAMVDPAVDDIRRTIARFDRALRVEDVVRLHAGRMQPVYRVKLGGDASLVLKWYPEDPAGCVREASVLAAMHGWIPVPQAEVHAACVQVDATVVPVDAAIESQEVPPVGGW